MLTIAFDGVEEFDLREKHALKRSSRMGRHYMIAQLPKEVLDLLADRGLKIRNTSSAANASWAGSTPGWQLGWPSFLLRY